MNKRIIKGKIKRINKKTIKKIIKGINKLIN